MDEKPDNESVLTFQYWSDPMCIWAFVGRSKLDRVLEEFGPHVAVEYKLVPVFGSIPQRFRSGSWATQGREGRRETTRKIAAEHGFEGVTGEVWTTTDPQSSWSCGAAAKAVLLMEQDEEADHGAGAAYLRRMRERFYLDNSNICERSEQLAIAESLDIDPGGLLRRLDDGSALASLWEDETTRADLGVRGSPSYVFDGGRAVLYGNFPFSVLHAVVHEFLDGLELGGSAC